MIHHSRPARTDHRVWDGTLDLELSRWLGPGTHRWTRTGQLFLRTPDGNITVRPGWSILRWDDGELTVASPRIVARLWQPEGRCSGAVIAAFTHTPHPVHDWTPQPSMPSVRCPGNQDIRP